MPAITKSSLYFIDTIKNFFANTPEDDSKAKIYLAYKQLAKSRASGANRELIAEQITKLFLENVGNPDPSVKSFSYLLYGLSTDDYLAAADCFKNAIALQNDPAYKEKLSKTQEMNKAAFAYLYENLPLKAEKEYLLSMQLAIEIYDRLNDSDKKSNKKQCNELCIQTIDLLKIKLLTPFATNNDFEDFLKCTDRLFELGNKDQAIKLLYDFTSSLINNKDNFVFLTKKLLSILHKRITDPVVLDKILNILKNRINETEKKLVLTIALMMLYAENRAKQDFFEWEDLMEMDNSEGLFLFALCAELFKEYRHHVLINVKKKYQSSHWESKKLLTKLDDVLSKNEAEFNDADSLSTNLLKFRRLWLEEASKELDICSIIIIMLEIGILDVSNTIELIPDNLLEIFAEKLRSSPLIKIDNSINEKLTYKLIEMLVSEKIVKDEEEQINFLIKAARIFNAIENPENHFSMIININGIEKFTQYPYFTELCKIVECQPLLTVLLLQQFFNAANNDEQKIIDKITKLIASNDSHVNFVIEYLEGCIENAAEEDFLIICSGIDKIFKEINLKISEIKFPHQNEIEKNKRNQKNIGDEVLILNSQIEDLEKEKNKLTTKININQEIILKISTMQKEIFEDLKSKYPSDKAEIIIKELKISDNQTIAEYKNLIQNLKQQEEQINFKLNKFKSDKYEKETLKAKLVANIVAYDQNINIKTKLENSLALSNTVLSFVIANKIIAIVADSKIAQNSQKFNDFVITYSNYKNRKQTIYRPAITDYGIIFVLLNAANEIIDNVAFPKKNMYLDLITVLQNTFIKIFENKVNNLEDKLKNLELKLMAPEKTDTSLGEWLENGNGIFQSPKSKVKNAETDTEIKINEGKTEIPDPSGWGKEQML